MSLQFRPLEPRKPAPPGDIVRGFVTFREATRTFEIDTRIPGYIYPIEADRILTSRQFTDWIWQLHGKNWMTGQHFSDLLRCISDFIFRQWGDTPQPFYEVTGGGAEGLDRA